MDEFAMVDQGETSYYGATKMLGDHSKGSCRIIQVVQLLL